VRTKPHVGSIQLQLHVNENASGHGNVRRRDDHVHDLLLRGRGSGIVQEGVKGRHGVSSFLDRKVLIRVVGIQDMVIMFVKVAKTHDIRLDMGKNSWGLT